MINTKQTISLSVSKFRKILKEYSHGSTVSDGEYSPEAGREEGDCCRVIDLSSRNMKVSFPQPTVIKIRNILFNYPIIM